MFVQVLPLWRPHRTISRQSIERPPASDGRVVAGGGYAQAMHPGTPPPADNPYDQGQGQFGQPQQPPYPPGASPGAGQPYPPPPPPGQGYAAPPGYGTPPGYGGPPQSQPNNVLGLLGMIFGIVGIPLSLCCGLFGLPFPVAAIVLGALGMRRVSEGRATNRGMALAGVICGAIGVVLAIISVALGAASYFVDP